jgi:hypothetical protein
MVGPYSAHQFVSGVPQRPQKVRVTDGEELYSTGFPAENAKSPAFTYDHRTTAAAEALRQVRH